MSVTPARRIRVVTIAIGLLFFLICAFIAQSPTFPRTQAASAPLQVLNPPTDRIGLDMGTANFAFSANQFSWSNGGYNITLLNPGLTIIIIGASVSTSCIITFSTPTLTHNATTYIWTFVAPSAVPCGNGASITPIMHLYVNNVTGFYNKKEVIVQGVNFKVGCVTCSVKSIAKLTFQTPSGSFAPCKSGTNQTTGLPFCTSIQVGSTSFDFSSLAGAFPLAYNNQTNSLSVNSSISANGNYFFDPLATDGAGLVNIPVGSKSGNCVLSTTGTSDIILVGMTGGTNTITLNTPTSPNLRFYLRGTEQLLGTGSTQRRFDVWYANTTTPLTNENINVSESANALAVAGCEGVSGADRTTIWDTGSSFPLQNSSTNTKPWVNSFTTATAPVFAFFWYGQQGNPTQTVGTIGGATAIGDKLVSQAPGSYAEHAILNSTVSGSLCNYGTSSGSGNVWGGKCDAIKQGVTGFTHDFTQTILLTPYLTSVNLAAGVTSSMTLSPSVNVGAGHFVTTSLTASGSLGAGLGINILAPTRDTNPNSMVVNGTISTTVQADLKWNQPSLIYVWAQNDATATYRISDTLGLTFHVASNQTGDGESATVWAYASSANPSSFDIITLVWSASGVNHVSAVAWNGAYSASPVDASCSGTFGAGGLGQSCILSKTLANDLVVVDSQVECSGSHCASSADFSFKNGSGFVSSNVMTHYNAASTHDSHAIEWGTFTTAQTNLNASILYNPGTFVTAGSMLVDAIRGNGNIQLAGAINQALGVRVTTSITLSGNLSGIIGCNIFSTCATGGGNGSTVTSTTTQTVASPEYYVIWLIIGLAVGSVVFVRKKW